MAMANADGSNQQADSHLPQSVGSLKAECAFIQ